MHKIHQSRNLALSVSIRRGDEFFSDKTFRVYTGSQKYGSEDEFTQIILDENGTAGQKIKYNHSFVGIELPQSFLAMGNGIDTAFFSWYRPGTPG